MSRHLLILLSLIATVTTSSSAFALYLNDTNISVTLGNTMPAEPFMSRSTTDSLASIIDAESATSSERYIQGKTNVTLSNASLELDFDLGISHELITHFHFWNFNGETFDVDQISLNFSDQNNSLINSTPIVLTPTFAPPGPLIFAEDFDISVSDARYVNALLTGTNGQVSFLNIGFTAVPLPAGIWFIISGLSVLFSFRSRVKKA